MVNFLDNIISFIDPSAGLKRAQKRAALSVIKRGYEGARQDRRTKGWKVDEFNERHKLRELRTLKARSRDLYQNNPYANRAHNAIANNTTGTGILPAIQGDRIKKIWNAWADEITADFDRNLNFYGIQNLCMRTMSMHGGVLVLRIRTKANSGIPLELKVLSTRYLDLNHDTDQTPSGGYITGGIEFDSTGKRKGYWIYPKDPNIDQVQGVFWEDKDVIHLYRVEEPGQNHGVPFGASSMMSLRDYDDYEDAQLMRQKIAACFAVFVTGEADTISAADPAAEEERLEKVEPGIIEHLAPGKQVTFASPPPAEGYADYSRNVLTGVASGFNMSYESMTGDLSNVSYSSGRMGWLEFQNSIENWQWFIIIPKLCKTVWTWFVEAGMLAGKLPKTAPVSVNWTAPGRKMIDPVKEVNGLLSQVRAGFMSWQEAVRTLGYTPEEVLQELKESASLFDSAGIEPRCDPRFDSTKIEDNGDNTDSAGGQDKGS